LCRAGNAFAHVRDICGDGGCVERHGRILTCGAS
jgi:hypothetical protein